MTAVILLALVAAAFALVLSILQDIEDLLDYARRYRRG